MSKIKPIWEHGAVSPESPNKVFCTAPWTHTYISPQSERRMCCASREEHQFQKQYIDATNDTKYGEIKESKIDVIIFEKIGLIDSSISLLSNSYSKYNSTEVLFISTILNNQ